MDNLENAQMQMPKYRCHKEVWALKIKNIVMAPAEQERQHSGGDWYLVPENTCFKPICVGQDDFMLKHMPEIGGYLVVYADGYRSYSPAKPFEDGYTLIS